MSEKREGWCESRRRGGHMRFHSRHNSAGVSSGNPASQRHYWIFLFFFFSLSGQGGESVCTGRIEEGGLNRVSLTSEGSAAGAWFSFTSADPRQNTARPFKAPGFEVRGEPQIQALRHICPVWKISSHVRLPAPLKFHRPLFSPCSNREITSMQPDSKIKDSDRAGW